MVNRSPQIMLLTINFHKNFVDMPTPIWMATYPLLFNLFCKQWPKSVPPKSYRFVANINPSFMQNIFYLAQAKWKSHIIHHGKLDDFGTGFEIFERIALGHKIEFDSLSRFNQVPLTRPSLESQFSSTSALMAKKRPKWQSCLTFYNFVKWCCKGELNSRPRHYQWRALPLSYCSILDARFSQDFHKRKGKLSPEPSALPNSQSRCNLPQSPTHGPNHDQYRFHTPSIGWCT